MAEKREEKKETSYAPEERAMHALEERDMYAPEARAMHASEKRAMRLLLVTTDDCLSTVESLSKRGA